MSLLSDIVTNVAPLVETAARAAGVDVDEIMDTARTLQQSLTDWLPNGIIPTAQKIVGLSSEGSAIGASMPTATKFMVDDVLFQVIKNESLENEVDIPEHPTEDRQMIADHTWRRPERLSISGSLIGYPASTERHKEALDGLRKIKEEGLPVTVICDFPPGRLEDMALVRFSATREYPWKNEYLVDLEMQHCEYVGKATTEAGLESVAGRDPGSPPGTAVTPEGSPTQGGLKASKTGEAPPQDVFGGILGKIRQGIEALSETKLGKMAMDWGKDMLRNSIPGAGLVMDALSGNFSAKSLLEAGASFIPGGAALLDTALGAIDTGMQALEAIGGLGALADVVSGATSLESAAKTVGGAVIDRVTRGNATLGAVADVVSGKTSLEAAATGAIGALVDKATEGNPALGAIAGMAKGALGI